MSRVALDESLARLDAALGTTASRPRVHTPTIPLGELPYDSLIIFFSLKDQLLL